VATVMQKHSSDMASSQITLGFLVVVLIVNSNTIPYNKGSYMQPDLLIETVKRLSQGY